MDTTRDIHRDITRDIAAHAQSGSAHAARPKTSITTDIVRLAMSRQLNPARVRFLGMRRFRAMSDLATRLIGGRRERLDVVRDITIAGRRGAVPLRLYRIDAADPARPQPVLLFFHGGAYNIGSIDTHDYICRYLARHAGAVVISVGYRLAPEHPYPAALEDCYAALQWAYERAWTFNGDRTRIAIAGDSAGGGLAAKIAFMARDRKGPSLCCQLLIYPVVTPEDATASREQFATRYGLNRDFIDFSRRLFVTDSALLSEMRLLTRDDLRGLPYTMVITAECDPLRDEGEIFADRLSRAGVPAERARFRGMIHGFISMGLIYREAYAALDLAAARLRTAFSGAHG
ncbi:MAG TPA: alpha/beta hydrolase [Spirochaetota bacterium]|nr:alpha/beta hydrolase [Spirochaetota bacterium]HNT09410.1 alpha/beta hydrolase [Spirochaetota bacterium]HNV46173.1 alpha/beta hydrolase [Spirochaetota bacterium]HPU86753.1 alpha/beta hydrolase [Spirochaetota bacterium]